MSVSVACNQPPIFTRKIVVDDLRANYCEENLKGFVRGVLLNPGFSTIFWHRLAVHLFRMGGGARLLGKLLWVRNTFRSGCHFNMNAELSGGLYLPHPTAIVIGAGAVVEANVALYQGVTLGAKKPGGDDYPTIKEGVTIFSGAIVVGRIYVGRHSVVAPNSFVNIDVEENSLAYGSPAKQRPL